MASFKVARRAQRNRPDRNRHFQQLHHGKVVLRRAAHHARGNWLLAGIELHQHFLRILDHVVVGDNMALRIPHKAAAGTLQYGGTEEPTIHHVLGGDVGYRWGRVFEQRHQCAFMLVQHAALGNGTGLDIAFTAALSPRCRDAERNNPQRKQ